MHRITHVLSVGRFATPERAADLLAAGVTHVLNVSEAPAKVIAGEAAFREVVWVPLDDFRPIPEPVAVRALDTLHRMAAEPGAHVYVHCIAGQMRAPTVLWLYLVACGLDPDVARELIGRRSPDAVPGALRLVGPDLLPTVRAHGLANYVPHPRGEVLVPFGLESRSDPVAGHGTVPG
jgi:hypothetical protein